ncbi:MAG TPA: hypothetical protein VFZ79_02615 [Acidimicrobiales bacterium]
MPIDLDSLVAGEPLRLLLQALAQLEMTPDDDGGATVTGTVDPEAGAALQRALERIRAESATGGPPPPADPDDSDAPDAMADAFTLLLQRVLDATGA